MVALGLLPAGCAALPALEPLGVNVKKFKDMKINPFEDPWD